MRHRRQRCGGCGQSDSMVLEVAGIAVDWAQHGHPGRKTTADRWRCLGCAGEQILQEGFRKEHEKDPSRTAGVRHVVTDVT